MKTIVIANQKGGVSKTTTAAALASGLALNNKKVLAIDLDAQCNLTYILDAPPTNVTALGVLTQQVKTADAIQHTATCDIIPADARLTEADKLITGTGREYRLKEAIEGLNYDYCIIDTPPALSILTTTALTSADEVLIPMQADIYSLQGLDALASTIEAVRKYCNEKLTIAGLLFTRYNERITLTRELTALAGQIAGRLNTRVLNTKIHEAVAVRESQALKKCIYDYGTSCKPAADYMELMKELKLI